MVVKASIGRRLDSVEGLVKQNGNHTDDDYAGITCKAWKFDCSNPSPKGHWEGLNAVIDYGPKPG